MGLRPVQMVLTTHYSLKAASLKQFPYRMVGGVYIPSMGVGSVGAWEGELRKVQMPVSSLQVNWQSCPLNDLLQQI